jgi:ABC-type arginine/histidine transport system permease subunit
MMQNNSILYDPIFLTIISIAISVVVAGIIYLMQRQKKELSYKIISSSPLLQSKAPLAQKLQVLYDGKQLLNPHLLTPLNSAYCKYRKCAYKVSRF